MEPMLGPLKKFWSNFCDTNGSIQGFLQHIWHLVDLTMDTFKAFGQKIMRPGMGPPKAFSSKLWAFKAFTKLLAEN